MVTEIRLRAVLCLLLLAGSAAGATFSGTVTDADTKLALPSMVVAAYSSAGFLQGQATTDSQGAYHLTVPDGAYRVLAYDPLGAYATTFGSDADSFETSTLFSAVGNLVSNFALRRAGTITGTVMNTDNAAIPGMTVSAYNLASGTRRGFTQADAHGMYSLVLPAGQYKIATYDAAGTYGVRFYQDQPAFATATPVTVVARRATTGIDFRLSFAAHLTGSVIDADTQLPLGSMIVIGYSADGTVALATTTSDPSGNFTLTLPAGSCKVVAADSQHIYATGYLADANSFAASQLIDLSPGQLLRNVVLPMHRAGTVSGRVLEASGSALAAMTIAAYNIDGSLRSDTRSDAAGNYTLHLPPGPFRIAAYDSAVVYATQFYPARDDFEDANTILVSAGGVTAGVDFSLIRGTRFSGLVTDQASGAPVAGVSVAVFDDEGHNMTTATTGADGKYVLTVPPGSYRLAAFDPALRYTTAYSGGATDYEHAEVYRVESSQAQQLDFTLQHGVLVTGTVIDDAAAFVTISGVRVGALDLSGNRVASATTTNGIFNMVLAPGTYKLLATDPEHRFAPSFYNGAATLDLATAVVIQSNGADHPISILLTRLARHRAAPH